ncbi:MAG: YceI family protein [Bacteroidota bacterium]
MKKIVLSLLMAITGACAVAQYKPVDNGSSVQFKIKNFGVNTGGSFSGLQGDIKFDGNHLEDAVVDVSIDANTVNTGNETRDNHLRGETYFDVQHFPRIHFVSSKVTAAVGASSIVSGKLTIKNKTKDISFPFTAVATAEGYLFKGTFVINRREFGVGSTSVISDNLEVQLSVLAKK